MKKLLVFLAIFTSLNIYSKSLENIAVVDFSSRGVKIDSASTISDLVRSEISKSGSFRVLERTNMDKVLSEYEFQSSGITNTENAVKAGKILNVKMLVYGSLSKLGNAYFISVTIVDIETGRIAYSENEKFYKIEDSDIAVKRIVQRITKQKVKGAEKIYSTPITGNEGLDEVLNKLKRKYIDVKSKRYRREVIDYLYVYDEIAEKYYAFVLYKVIDIPTKEVKIKAASNYLPGITFSPPYTTMAAKKAYNSGKEFAVQARVFNAPKGDPRIMEYRVYQKNGKPIAIEIFIIARNADWTPKKPKSLKYKISEIEK